MFKRVFGQAFICPKCRQNSFLQERTLANSQLRRLRSTTAYAQEDIDDPDGEADDANVSQTHSSGFRYRHWRPPPTAQLGIDALGQPTEVLVLSKTRRNVRNREFVHKDTALPVEGQAISDQPPIFESLKGELKSPSQSEVTAHIETIKSEIPKTRGTLEKEQWVKTRESLAKSFSVKQLKEYYGSMSEGDKQLNITHPTRTVLAEQIMQDVWGYTDVSQEKGLGAHTSVRLTERTYRTRYRTLLMLNQRKLQTHGVLSPEVKILKITDIGIRLSGPVEAVEDTMISLRSLEAQLATIVLPVTGKLQAQLAKVRSYQPGVDQLSHELEELRDIILRSRVMVTSTYRNRHLLKIQGIDNVHIDRFLQQLILWMDVANSTKMNLSSPLDQSEEVCTIPVINEKRDQINPVWQRYVRKTPIEDNTNDITGFLSDDNKKDIQSNILETNATAEIKLSQSVIFNAAREQVAMYAAEIGTAVFQPRGNDTMDHSKMNLDRFEHEKETLEALVNDVKSREHNEGNPVIDTAIASIAGDESRSWTFITHLPLFAQFLARQRPFEPVLRPTPSAEPTTTKPKTLIRLLYQTLDEQHPHIEIHATLVGSELTVNRLTGVLSSAAHYTALPHLVADLKVSKTIGTVLYEDGVPLDAKLAPFMAIVAQSLSSISRTPAGEIQGIEPLISFNLSHFSNPLNAVSQGLVSEANAPSAGSGLKSVPFILRSAEQVQCATFKTPVFSSFLVEYLLHEPIRNFPRQERREILRIVEKPLIAKSHVKSPEMANDESVEAEVDRKTWKPIVIGSDPTKFDQFLKAAYGTMLSFNASNVEKSHSIVKANLGGGQEDEGEEDALYLSEGLDDLALD